MIEQALIDAKEMEMTKQALSNHLSGSGTVEDVQTLVQQALEKFLQNELKPVTLEEIQDIVYKVLMDNMSFTFDPKIKAKMNNKGEVMIDVSFTPMVSTELKFKLDQLDKKHAALIEYIDERLNQIKLEE